MSKSRWNDAKELKPDGTCRVLMVTSSIYQHGKGCVPCVTEGSYIPGEGFKLDGETDPSVTHWMPMPPLPQKGARHV